MSFGQVGLWSRTSLTPGVATCPSCGAPCGGSGMPACRFECAPVTWAPDTSGRASCLLPTLTASSYGSSQNGRRPDGSTFAGAGKPSLQRMLPTLVASDGGAKGSTRYERGNPTLRGAMLPTLTARDWRSGQASEETMTGNARPLPEVLTDSSPPASGTLLDPGWCEAFMGFPAGWTDPGDGQDGPAPAYAPPGSTPSETPSFPKPPKRSGG